MIPDSWKIHIDRDIELKKKKKKIYFNSLVTVDAFDTLLLLYMYVDLKIIKVIIVWKLFTDVKKRKKDTVKLQKNR